LLVDQAVSFILQALVVYPLMLSPGLFSFLFDLSHPQIGHHCVEQVKFNADQKKLTSQGHSDYFLVEMKLIWMGTQDYSMDGDSFSCEF